MSRTYKATGINLKGMPLGESDRLLTILTREEGLIRAIAPGARKPSSRLSGRSGLFVVNELLIYKGRSLDKITQAMTIQSYSGLSLDLGKLAAGQYLAELVLCQAFSDQPQEELFCLLCEHLSRLDRALCTAGTLSPAPVVSLLAHGIYHMLALAGIAPQVHTCCVSSRPLTPDFTQPDWRVGFSVVHGGTFSLSERDRLEPPVHVGKVGQPRNNREFRIPHSTKDFRHSIQLNAAELAMLQQLTQPDLPPQDALKPNLPEPIQGEFSVDRVWVSLERLLREYAQYHFGRSIRSATLMDTYTGTRL